MAPTVKSIPSLFALQSASTSVDTRSILSSQFDLASSTPYSSNLMAVGRRVPPPCTRCRGACAPSSVGHSRRAEAPCAQLSLVLLPAHLAHVRLAKTPVAVQSSRFVGKEDSNSRAGDSSGTSLWLRARARAVGANQIRGSRVTWVVCVSIRRSMRRKGLLAA
jgi:hypothetical protein